MCLLQIPAYLRKNKMGLKNSKNILIENIIYLFILQGVNYILPLVTFPYIVRILGLERFGLIAFGMSFVQYFVLITDYGFNLTATQDISRVRDNIEELSVIFCSVMTVKTIFMFLCALVYATILIVFDKFRSDALLYLTMFLAVPGNVLYPVWLFQGLEKMKLLSIISCSVKAIITIMIFLFVKKQSDYILAAFIQVSGIILSGLIALSFVKKDFGLKVFIPSRKMIVDAIKKGWYVFISQVSVTMFTNSNIFILGIFTNNIIVGYFSIAEKIIRAVIGITVPITTAVYPYISELFNRSRDTAILFIRKVLKYGSAVFFLTSLALFMYSDSIVLLISGNNNKDISILIKIMSILPLSVFWDNIWGTQVMLNNGMNRNFMYIMLGAGIISVVSALIFVPIFAALATSLIFVLTEILILSAMIFCVRKKGIYIVKENAL